MNSRNKQQNDIMYNLNIEFGIHGVNNGQKLVDTINEVLSKSGDTIRIVGCSIKKPTARVDLRNLCNSVMNVTDEEIAKIVSETFDNYIRNLNSNMNSFTNPVKHANAEKEVSEHDEESNRID